MKTLRMPLRVVFYQEEGQWIAHCLEFDTIGHGPDKQSAMEMMVKATNIQVEQSFRYGNLANLFSPADGEYFRMFAAGTDIGEGSFTLKIEPAESVIIERTDAREYTDSDLVPA